ncbi:endonuclease domain-containing protein [Acaryochloris sp. IP29b_bin.148]|uniref:endonuclease domain-containing protein n=1 Tax=Acaryochloris sp. IP29b_bin.148 TaxID=2969218 RepID=UPI0026091829|nr:endonuclease domain-containing protein [Acaryochloris sp. IP29b_bin.148]
MREKQRQHYRIRGTTPAIIAAARRLRLNLTTAEQKLWKALQKRQLSGLKFRCQHPISSFIVDFYCPQCRLVIELDGDIHNQQVEYDEARTEQLNQLGYRVIRFHNSDVMHHLEHVLQQIRHASEQSIALQSKSPRMGDLGG